MCLKVPLRLFLPFMLYIEYVLEKMCVHVSHRCVRRYTYTFYQYVYKQL